jgi:carbon monoxide dehydrogenase subunit G
MEMTGEVRIEAPREEVWAALNDPEVLKASIPGCTDLQKLSDSTMAATVQTKVGMVRATFTGAVILTNVKPPESYTITGEGKGGVAGFAKGSADVRLEADSDATILRYTARGQVGGKLAQIGARLIDATAKQMADQFFTAFAEEVGRRFVTAEGTVAHAGHTVEDAVEGAAHAVAEAAEEVEEEVEEAAVRGFLGGPPMWALLALVVVVIAIIILR